MLIVNKIIKVKFVVFEWFWNKIIVDGILI